MQAIVDGSNGNTAATAIGYIQAVASDYSQRAFVRSLERAGVTGLRSTIDFRPRVLFNPELRSANFLMPGLIMLILILTSVMSTAISIVREKERGTMEQISVSPVRPLELIVGKAVPYLLIGLVAAAAILAASRFLFGVEVHGSWLDLSIVTLLFLVGGLGLGVLLSTVAESQQVALLLSVMLTVLPAFILSGFVFPFHNMPPVIQGVSYLLPGRYYLAALRAIMVKGTGFWAFKEQVIALAIFALVTAGGSVLRLRGRRNENHRLHHPQGVPPDLPRPQAPAPDLHRPRAADHPPGIRGEHGGEGHPPGRLRPGSDRGEPAVSSTAS